MRYVLTGSREQFERFKRALWRNDKDISNLRHITRSDQIRGLCGPDNKLLRLSGWNELPDSYEIVQMCYRNGMLARPRTGRRPDREPRFRNGRIVSGDPIYNPIGGIEERWLATTMPAPEITATQLISFRDVYSDNRNVTIPSGYSIDPDRLRGMSFDSITMDESVTLPLGSSVTESELSTESAFVRATRASIEEGNERMRESLSRWDLSNEEEESR